MILLIEKWMRTPLVCEYKMDNNIIDTLSVNLGGDIYKPCLWLRYNNSGDKVLYGLYDEGAILEYSSRKSEIGILNLNTMNKKSFDVDINTSVKGSYESIFPEWSPDNSMILFSGTDVSTNGGVGNNYSLYILKNVVY